MICNYYIEGDPDVIERVLHDAGLACLDATIYDPYTCSETDRHRWRTLDEIEADLEMK